MPHRTFTPQPRAIEPPGQPDWLADALTPPVFGRYYGVTGKTVRSYIAAGLIRAYRVGPRNYRIPRSELDRLLTEVTAA